MRNAIAAIMIYAFSNTAFARGEAPVAELVFQNQQKTHRYTLLQQGKKQTYTLIFYENGKSPKQVQLNKSQGEFIKNESTRLIWLSEYRKPARVEKCTRYVAVSSRGEKTAICRENPRAVGLTFGLLNSMRQFFR